MLMSDPDRTRHRGYTFPLFLGGSDAVEGVFGNEREAAVCGSPNSSVPSVPTCRRHTWGFLLFAYRSPAISFGGSCWPRLPVSRLLRVRPGWPGAVRWDLPEEDRCSRCQDPDSPPDSLKDHRMGKNHKGKGRNRCRACWGEPKRHRRSLPLLQFHSCGATLTHRYARGDSLLFRF